MKATVFSKSVAFKWVIRIFLLMAVTGIVYSNHLQAKTAREIDISVDVAIERFHAQVIGAKQLIEASKGMLVMPNVFKGAFLMSFLMCLPFMELAARLISC